MSDINQNTQPQQGSSASFHKVPAADVTPRSTQHSGQIEQQPLYYRPPSEADSFLVQVMKGCPHNKCTFCGMFKKQKCQVIPTSEVLKGMERDAEDIGPELLKMFTSLYLEGGDPFVLQTRHLLSILNHAHKCFPALQRVTCYATAHFICCKAQNELNDLAKAGLTRVYVGMESGNDAILRNTNKGCTRADLLRVGQMLHKAGIENDVSIMLGIGGKDLSVSHALDTGTLISALEPACVRIRTFLPIEDTPMGDAYRAGSFLLPEPHEILRELELIVRQLTGRTTLLSEHWTNFLTFMAEIPKDKERLLRFIKEALRQPRDAFRPTGISSVAV